MMMMMVFVYSWFYENLNRISEFVFRALLSFTFSQNHQNLISRFNKLVNCNFTQLGIERVQALADISRSALCCHSNETRAPIANPPNTAQLEGTPYHSQSYIWVRAVVWECGEGQTCTHRPTDRHRDARDQYIHRLGYGSWEM